MSFMLKHLLETKAWVTCLKANELVRGNLREHTVLMLRTIPLELRKRNSPVL